MPKVDRHQTHPEILKRLKRAAGHLDSVVAMIEAGRPCLDVAQQLQAVESAIAKAKRTLVHDHLDHCLESASGPKREKPFHGLRVSRVWFQREDTDAQTVRFTSS